jgi:hypothetical protein
MTSICMHYLRVFMLILLYKYSNIDNLIMVEEIYFYFLILNSIIKKNNFLGDLSQ